MRQASDPFYRNIPYRKPGGSTRLIGNLTGLLRHQCDVPKQKDHANLMMEDSHEPNEFTDRIATADLTGNQYPLSVDHESRGTRGSESLRTA